MLARVGFLMLLAAVVALTKARGIVTNYFIGFIALLVVNLLDMSKLFPAGKSIAYLPSVYLSKRGNLRN